MSRMDFIEDENKGLDGLPNVDEDSPRNELRKMVLRWQEDQDYFIRDLVDDILELLDSQE